jgi:hypothetical protein
MDEGRGWMGEGQQQLNGPPFRGLHIFWVAVLLLPIFLPFSSSSSIHPLCFSSFAMLYQRRSTFGQFPPFIFELISIFPM